MTEMEQETEQSQASDLRTARAKKLKALAAWYGTELDPALLEAFDAGHWQPARWCVVSADMRGMALSPYYGSRWKAEHALGFCIEVETPVSVVDLDGESEAFGDLFPITKIVAKSSKQPVRLDAPLEVLVERGNRLSALMSHLDAEHEYDFRGMTVGRWCAVVSESGEFFFYPWHDTREEAEEEALDALGGLSTESPVAVVDLDGTSQMYGDLYPVTDITETPVGFSNEPL